MTKQVNPLQLLIAVALLLASACSDAGSSTSTTSGVTTSTSPDTTTAAPAPETTTTAVPVETTAPPTTTEPPDLALPGWDTWTLIHASLAVDSHDREDAAAVAAGIDGAGVLLSSDYPSLNPGYWVVYGGAWGSRRQAGLWCPESLDPELTCYPRYLGPSIPALLRAGAALAQLDQGRLGALDPSTGELLATFSDDFHWEAEFPSHFNLTADFGELYYGMGWEDSWFSCASDGGEVWRLDLDSGAETVFSSGWSPAISPDGRWLAVVSAAECYPDPEHSGWVISPGSQIEVYDLADGDNRPDHVLVTAAQPTSYEDPNAIGNVGWDPATGRDLLVSTADGSVRRIAYDSNLDITNAPIEPNVGADTFAVATIEHLYRVEYDGDITRISKVERAGGETVDVYETDVWVTGLARGRAGGVMITTWEHLILPTGEQVPVAGGINNLAW